jgi:predicted deacetylase
VTRIAQPAQYLLRIDDLCPAVHERRWQRLAAIIREFHIRPILAVVPDNQDAELRSGPPDPAFWAQIRAMQASGAAIAIHGYRHQCVSRGKSILPFHRHTEFSGRPVEEQREMLHAGLNMLRAEGLNTRLWVAPRHGFDWNTLAALREEGIRYLSDGIALRPFLRGGVVWIPQQIWEPVEQRRGLWTICLHPNTTTRPVAQNLHDFLSRHAAHFTSFDRVTKEYEAQKLSPGEQLYEALFMSRLRLRHSAKRLVRQWRQGR